MPADPWDNPTKVYPKGEIEVLGREPVELDPAYLNEHLIAVHADMLFYEDESHWRLNPALDPE